MKKRVSFSVRLMSVILTFLLLFTTIAGAGITTASAKEIESGEHVEVCELSNGDILNEGVRVTNFRHSLSGAYFYEVYIDKEFIDRKYGLSILIDRRVVLVSKEKSPNRADTISLYFKSVSQDDKEFTFSDAALKEELQNNETVNLSEDVYLTNTLTINDGKSHTINTNGHNIFLDIPQKGVIAVENGSTLTINGLGENEDETSISDGGDRGSDSGAVKVSANSKFVANNVVFTGNSSKNGGGVSVFGGSVELTDCTFTNNNAKEKGGGIFIDENSTADLTGCTFESNGAYDGGGICSYGTLNVKDCIVKHNSVSGGGAGIWSNGNAVISGTTVDQNTNAYNGGGVTNHHNMTIRDCTISGNSASRWGGGIYLDADSNTVLEGKNVIRGNTSNDGAGIFLYKGNLSASNTSFLNNSAKEAGGGIWANSGTEISFLNVKMQGNSCKTNGGAINSHGTVSLKNCAIDSNSADNCGGGAYMDSGSTLTIVNSSITYCQAKAAGGGIYFYAGELVLAGGKIRITDNQTNGKSDNVNQREFRNIQIKGELSSGSEIGFKPPENGANRNITTGYGQSNSASPALYFHCDTNDYKVNKDKKDEVNILEGLRATYSSYKVKIYIKVTDDADLWDHAYFHIYGKGNKGKGSEVLLNSSPNFKTSIDEGDESYTYEYDCGADNFPTAVNFVTKFGFAGQRDFEGDITIYINGVNVVNNHVRHVVWECQEKNTWLYITGDKYPYPDPDTFDVDVPPGNIEESGIVTVSAVDQYGLIWKADGANTSMKNISFPGEDTFQMLDNSGFKWKLSSNHQTNHWSTYNLIFKSGSNVYPEIIRPITVKFTFPLHLRVLVDGKEVFERTGREKDTIQIRNIESIPGYFINGYEKTGTGELAKVEGADYNLTFVNESVTLTAKLKPNNYRIAFDANGTKGDDGEYKDIDNYMSRKTAYYDSPFTLTGNKFMRKGHTFVGWNTQPDGRGIMYKDKDTVLNLTDKKGAEVKLYAIWKPNDSPTTASIFSDGTALIYVGAGILILSIAASVIYSKRKKREGVKAVKQ